MPKMHSITISVNGKRFDTEVEPRIHLADFLRHQLELTGTHIGCEHGVCGACTVLVDGVSVRSCLMFAIQASGANVETLKRVAAQHGIVRGYLCLDTVQAKKLS